MVDVELSVTAKPLYISKFRRLEHFLLMELVAFLADILVLVCPHSGFIFDM